MSVRMMAHGMTSNSTKIYEITNSQVVAKIFAYKYFSRLLFVRLFIMIK